MVPKVSAHLKALSKALSEKTNSALLFFPWKMHKQRKRSLVVYEERSRRFPLESGCVFFKNQASILHYIRGQRWELNGIF